MRIAAPVAGGAAVISLLVGLLVGVPFSTALVRGLMSAVVFGALAIGVAYLARTQLPGLGQSAGAESPSADRPHGQSEPSGEAASGSRLNIVVEDDGESAGAEAIAGEGDSGDSDSQTRAESSEEDASHPPSDNEAASAESGSDITNRPRETVDDGSSSSGDYQEDDDQTADMVEEVEESAAEDEEAVMQAAISEEQDGTSMEIDDTMLDEMPDIGKYSSSFVSGGDTDSDGDETTGGSGQSGGLSGGSKQKAGDPRKGFDNKTVAKALQTLLAKDDE